MFVSSRALRRFSPPVHKYLYYYLLIVNECFLGRGHPCAAMFLTGYIVGREIRTGVKHSARKRRGKGFNGAKYLLSNQGFVMLASTEYLEGVHSGPKESLDLSSLRTCSWSGSKGDVPLTADRSPPTVSKIERQMHSQWQGEAKAS